MIGDHLPRQEAAAQQARDFETAADALVYQGDTGQAKIRYGGAIDAFLQAGRFEAAMETCRKLMRVAPEVVRTRYTLAYLLVGCNNNEEAEVLLWEYVRLVRQTRAEDYAIPRLGLLAHATADSTLRAQIGAMLAQLGAEADVDPAEGWGNPEERWKGLLPIVLQH